MSIRSIVLVNIYEIHCWPDRHAAFLNNVPNSSDLTEAIYGSDNTKLSLFVDTTSF